MLISKISILGCGWFGLPLAKHLTEFGYAVKGSTTRREKFPEIENSGADPHQITLTPDDITGDISGFLCGCEVLILDVPPRAKDVASDFPTLIKTLIPHISKHHVRYVIFVSSISVYGKDQGVVSEETLPQPDSPSGVQLLAAEELLRKNSAFSTTVVRFGGLIGDDRHPIHHLAGRSNLPDGDSPINLIHLTDCIAIVGRIISRNTFGGTFNAVAPEHPSRKSYYVLKAKELGLPMPSFQSGTKVGKTVLSEKIEQRLLYDFQVRI